MIEQTKAEPDSLVLYDLRYAQTADLDDRQAAETVWEHCHTLSVLQGIVNRDTPRLPVEVWLVEPDGSSKFIGAGTIPDSARPSTGSSKCDTYLWLKENYLDTGRCDGAFGAYYLDQYWIENPRASIPNHHCLTNHDFFVGKRAFFFDLHVWGDESPVDDPAQEPGTDLATLRELLLSAYHHGGRERMIHIGGFVPWAYKYTDHGQAGGTRGGVPSEWEYGKIISAYNGYMDADAIGYGAMANASFFAHFPLRRRYPQDWPSHADLRRRGLLDAKGNVDFSDRQFLLFYVGDYDCAAWVYQRTPDIWDDPNRGRMPLMWCNILKTPTWYLQVCEEVERLNPKLELLDGPSFFELLRIYLRNHPEIHESVAACWPNPIPA